jgi:hypothetical protein
MAGTIARLKANAGVAPDAFWIFGKVITTIVAGLVVLAAFLFLDWRVLLEKKQLRLNFDIWK